MELAEGVKQFSAHEFLSQCAIVLPQLYAAGHRLPDVEPGEEDPVEDESSKSKRLEQEALIRDQLASLLGEYDLYSEVFDPVSQKEAVVGRLSNDLSEVYSDLREPLLWYEQGNSIDAVWDWKLGLQTHYGRHIVDALRVIHQLITDHMPPDWQSS